MNFRLEGKSAVESWLRHVRFGIYQEVSFKELEDHNSKPQLSISINGKSSWLGCDEIQPCTIALHPSIPACFISITGTIINCFYSIMHSSIPINSLQKDADSMKLLLSTFTCGYE
jgi:hypothetical protein